LSVPLEERGRMRGVQAKGQDIQGKRRLSLPTAL